MKNLRRQSKKRTRAGNLHDLEEAFYGLVQKHNELVKAHSILRQRFDQQAIATNLRFSETEPRGYF